MGAGSAGCVLANRLSADPAVSVCLIEAGPSNGHWLMTMPRGVARLLQYRRYLWHYEAIRSGDGVAERWLKGRGLGGSSSINGMLYIRGHPADFDGWAAAGCGGWAWRDMNQVYGAIEDHELGGGARRQRGAGGPLKVTMHPGGDPFCEAFLDAAESVGLPRVPDINDAPDGGFGYQPRTVWRGRRQSAAQAFLRPARGRLNLRVETNLKAVRVAMAQGRATGVVVRRGAKEELLLARREVIVSAGAVESPKLLQLSGIDPADRLIKAGVSPVLDLSGVGRNLQEQLFLPVQYRVKSGSLNHQFTGWRLFRNVAQYALSRNGPMARAAVEMMGFAKSSPSQARPDIQIGVALYTMDMNKLGAIGRDPGITFGTCLMRPESRGQIYITCADADLPPRIEVTYLAHDSERAAPGAIVQTIRRIMAAPALASYEPVETLPGKDAVTRDDMLAFARRAGSSAYHVSGTCKMGIDDMAVVDPQLRVHGIKNLRVADTSIMPTIISGNTQAAAMAIGWRAADFILCEWSR